jgi:hypothetical protein
VSWTARPRGVNSLRTAKIAATFLRSADGATQARSKRSRIPELLAIAALLPITEANAERIETANYFVGTAKFLPRRSELIYQRVRDHRQQIRNHGRSDRADAIGMMSRPLGPCWPRAAKTSRKRKKPVVPSPSAAASALGGVERRGVAQQARRLWPPVGPPKEGVGAGPKGRPRRPGGRHHGDESRERKAPEHHRRLPSDEHARHQSGYIRQHQPA